MAHLMDRGDSYRVEYLGSAMLATMATGLGVLQKPLRDLYFRYKQSSKDMKLQPRHLTMTGSGMNMSFQNGAPSTPPQEVFYSMPSILFWDAVRFVAVKGPDKKIRSGFEPLDNDYSRNKDKIFSVLEKKYHFLQQQRHPALFACVLRRTSGVKALDMHAFVCTNEDEAMGLVHALNTVHANYTSDEVSESGVFGYNPFGKDSVRSTAAPGRSGLQVTGGADNRRLYGSSPHLDLLGAPQSRASIAVAPGRGGVPLPGIAHVAQKQLREYPPQQPVTKSKSYLQLTQEDFTPSPNNSLPRDEDRREAYDYLGHINKSLDRSQRADDRRAGDNALTRSQSQYSPRGRSGYIGQQDNISGSKTGQGYSLLSGSGGAPPGYHGPRPQPQQHEGHIPPRHRDGSPTGYQQTIQRTLPRGSSREEAEPWNPQDHYNPPPPLASPSAVQAHRNPAPVSQGPSTRRDPPLAPTHFSQPASESPRQTGAVYAKPGPRNPDSRVREPVTPSSRSMFGSAETENPNRPVAKVPPHKIQGIKVLPDKPTQPSARLRPTDQGESSAGYPLKKTQSPYKEPAYKDSTPPRDSNSKGKPTKGQNNWQFNSPAKPSVHEYKTLKPEEMAQKDGTGTNNEKLLMSQKKDAEIASVMQNLQFDYEANTISAHGTNFENALGYFP